MNSKEKKKITIYDLLLENLQENLKKVGLKGFKIQEAIKWLYKEKVTTFSEMTTLSLEERKSLAKFFQLSSLTGKTSQFSPRGTQKLLYELTDGNYIESVLIPTPKRITLCISTQVGCPIRCVFCASGMLGLKRNLETSEMVGQFIEASRISERPITNLVVMGMGEPFYNFEKVMKALQIINHQKMIGLGIRKMTLSTVGIQGFPDKMFDSPIRPRLAISLHAPTDELRQELIPFQKLLTIDEILDFLHQYSDRKRSRVTLEYVLLRGKNTDPELAHILGKKFSGFPLLVNLIPFNVVEELDFQRPSEEEADLFANILTSYGITVTIRGRHGSSIQAACGQLRLQAKKGTV